MDQARWMVIVSVFVCMIAVLTLLNRNFGQPAPATDVKKQLAQSASRTTTRQTSPVDTFAGAAKKGGWRSLISTRLKHRPPPEHTLALESPDAARESQAKMETEGRVIR